ncbi:MAG: hypothetical protein HZA36_03625, partial [Parcubacteria group bacterium]|nr:hypothetical protein [Parcubacteria group bacterium]
EKPKPSEKESENAENFLTTFVINNENLTPQAKTLITNQARSDRGPWGAQNFVTEVTQQDNKITIKTKSGESYLYIK